jgi:hypothetical protein
VSHKYVGDRWSCFVRKTLLTIARGLDSIEIDILFYFQSYMTKIVESGFIPNSSHKYEIRLSRTNSLISKDKIVYGDHFVLIAVSQDNKQLQPENLSERDVNFLHACAHRFAQDKTNPQNRDYDRIYEPHAWRIADQGSGLTSSKNFHIHIMLVHKDKVKYVERIVSAKV